MGRKTATATLAVILFGASIAVASAQPAPTSVRANSRYELCNFDDPSVPLANTNYPFRTMLTSRTGRSSNPNVRRAVRSIQAVLRSQGFTNRVGGPVQVDGDYGPATAYAVKQYQRHAGITVDGKVGRQTWRRLATEYCWMYH